MNKKEVAVELIDKMLEKPELAEHHDNLRIFQEEIRSGKMIFHYPPGEVNILDSMLIQLEGKTKKLV